MNEPVRVLHCLVNMNRGGAETLIMNIYKSIDRDKVQFDFFTSNEGVFDEEIKKMGGKIYRIPYITKVGPIKYAKSVVAFLKEHSEYKIIHSHMDKMSGLILREAKKAGVPIRIAHSHSTKSEGNILNRLTKAYYAKYIGNCATHKFACSKAASQFLFKNEEDVIILKNGIQTELYKYDENTRKKIRLELGIDDKFVIGHVGRFSEPKNHIFLLEIFKKVCEKNENSILCLVGNGVLEKRIKNYAIELGIEKKVVFLGIRSDVFRLLNAFDVFCFPSLYEGLPVTVIEAQTSGLKCVVSDVITREVDITENVEFVSLKEDAAVWAKKIPEGICFDRKDMTEIVKLAGYDITTTTNRIEKLYLKISREY